MPAYNAEKTLLPDATRDTARHRRRCDPDDDASTDSTGLAQRSGSGRSIHTGNRGYGGNQKTCYQEALRRGADIVVMVHPDYQYTPLLVTAMASMIAYGVYDVVLASRILGSTARRGRHAPLQVRRQPLSHPGREHRDRAEALGVPHRLPRLLARGLLEKLPLDENSDDFVFDNQMLVQMHYFGFRIGEISCPTRTSRRPPRSTSGDRSATAWACSG